MLNKIIKGCFATVGAVTGYTLAKTIFSLYEAIVSDKLKLAILFVSALLIAIAFYSIANKTIDIILAALDKVEAHLQKMTLYELAISSVGLIAGLIVANLITLPISKVDIIGVPLSILANVMFGCIGVGVSLSKKGEQLFGFSKDKKDELVSKGVSQPKVLDTSVIIDGRIVDICRSGFLEGELIIPGFVLEELRHIADSPDPLKRNRGRRGLDVLNILQKDMSYPVRVENIEIHEGAEVDDKLLKAAKELNGKIITIDYNLNKVACIHRIPVLNINELSNAVKPIALPGEEMVVQVIKDGKESGQGIGYLDDGTMIVVEGGRRHIGESINVTVTSVLQTAAGRMIFAKPKYSIERVV